MPDIRKTIILNRQEIERAVTIFACEMGWIDVNTGESAGLILINDHDVIKLTIEVEQEKDNGTQHPSTQTTPEDHGRDMGNSTTGSPLPYGKSPYKFSGTSLPQHVRVFEVFNEGVKQELTKEEYDQWLINQERSVDPGL